MLPVFNIKLTLCDHMKSLGHLLQCGAISFTLWQLSGSIHTIWQFTVF